MLQGSLAPILWVGNDSPINFVEDFFILGNEKVPLVREKSIFNAMKLITTQKFSAVYVCHDQPEESLEFFFLAKTSQSACTRVMVSESFTEAEVREGINRGQIYSFLQIPLVSQLIVKHLAESLMNHRKMLHGSLLIRESSHQNRQLEALTNSLEAMVEERTQYIQASHKEESDKLARERSLIRFINDLGTQTSFEDILMILRKELRKVHKMGDPILVFRLKGSKTFFIHYTSGHFGESYSKEYKDFPDEMGNLPADLIQYFANHFGRPFAKGLVFPVDLRLTKQFTSGRAEAILCIETSLSDKEAEAFTEVMKDRMGPLSMALDRVLLESELSRFAYRWEQTFDGLRDPIAIVDVDYNVTRANRRFAGTSMHHKCFQDFASRTEACEGCPVQQVLAEGKPAMGQVRRGERLYQVHSYPVLFKEGSRPTNVVNQYVDITESRELYLRMLQSEKMGAIGLLAGNIAHELNNPLTGLRSLAQVLLTEAPEGSTLKSDLQEIEKATARSQKIIKNLLEFSKGEDQPLESVALDEIVERTLPMLKSAMRNHRLQVHLHASQPPVYVEFNLIQQVVFNLVNNACQAMKENGTLSIRTYVAGEQAFLEVQDTGPGIPPEIKTRIFEPFFTTKKEGLGTGLGLSMSKAVIERFGGQIGLVDVDSGSCFRIMLPVRKA